MSRPRPVVLAGVAHLRSNRDRDPEAGREPLALLVEAARTAARDAGLPDALTRLDGVSVVHQLTWSYDDLAGRLARELGSPGARAEVGRVGGDTPLLLLAAAADRVSRGESRIELVCAAEALSSLKEAFRAGVDPGWSADPGGPFVVPDDWRGTPRMRRLGLDWPVKIYPLFENALRARLGQSFTQAQEWTGRIYSGFSRVSTSVAAAWNPGEVDAAEVVAAGPSNRMVCWPYPVRVNSLLMVDQAAAVLLVAPDVLPEARPSGPAVHLLGTAAGADSVDILDRPALDDAPALRGVLQGVLADTATGLDDLVALDLYSCFPVVPKLAALALGIDDDRPLTTTGGMNAFGGAGNGYALHGVVTTVKALRLTGGRGLVHANGEYLTKQAAAVLGVAALPPTWRELPAPEAGPVVSDGPSPGSDEAVTVETYTVEFGRDGSPARGWVIGRTHTGARSAGVTRDPAVLGELTDPEREPIGRPGLVSAVSENAPPVFQFRREDA